MNNLLRSLSRSALAAAFLGLGLGLSFAAEAAAAEVVLHDFTGGKKDGSSPQSDLIADRDGNLYGTTLAGGAKGGSGAGTIFELTPTGDPDVWTEAVIYDFKGGSDGAGPVGGLVMDKKGALYGTTQSGGAANSGTVFRVAPPKTGSGKWNEQVLYSFCAQADCTDGRFPTAGLVLGKKGVLFGTTQFGGSGAVGPDEGTVFQLSPPAAKGGDWSESVLYSFCNRQNCADGFEPNEGRLLLAGNGTLYGVTTKSDMAGTVYALTPSGGGAYAQSILHDFSLSNGDGRAPLGGLAADKKGQLYGTTQSDSGNGCGTVFRLSESGDLAGYRILYGFCAQPDHSDGALPYAGVIVTLGKKGVPSALYGTTLSAGIPDAGVVFKLVPAADPDALWNETVLYSFCSRTDCTDGSSPRFGPLLERNGALYGTTQLGGADNLGVVYRVAE
jgi:uncharacterized repeat protein (TIGR03803 family)